MGSLRRALPIDTTVSIFRLAERPRDTIIGTCVGEGGHEPLSVTVFDATCKRVSVPSISVVVLATIPAPGKTTSATLYGTDTKFLWLRNSSRRPIPGEPVRVARAKVPRLALDGLFASINRTSHAAFSIF
jgi:hypothetical protein